MCFAEFGQSDGRDPPQPILSPIHRLAAMTNGALGSYDLRLVLMEFYETQYQIYNHDDPALQSPLALVSLHPKENATEYSLLYRYLERYRLTGIKEEFGLSVLEFLRLPMDVAEHLLFMARDAMAKRQPEIDAALKGMKKGTER